MPIDDQQRQDFPAGYPEGPDPTEAEPADEDPGGGPEPTETSIREERAAAAEAGAIGGEAGDEDQDPAERAVREPGGGEAEGFEQAEDDLREHAEHGQDFRRPSRDAFAGEEETDRSSAVYGDPDRIDPAEPDLERDDV